MNDFLGQVLPGARTSPSNASTTDAADSGVSRGVYSIAGTTTELQGDRYRATLLDSGETTEYLLWAETSGPLAVAPGTDHTDGTATIPAGSLTVIDTSVPTTGIRTDGTNQVLVTDNGGRTLAAIQSLTYTRPGLGTPATFTLGGADYTFDPLSGVLTLLDTGAVRAAVNVAGPDPVAVSASRGDQFTATHYTLSTALFSWTRNDSTGTRFGWNAGHRKWELFRGKTPTSLGLLSSSASAKYALTPVPTTPVGQYLPGSTTTSQYSSVRLGALPNESSYPVVFRTVGPPFSGLLVVTDDLANSSYDFASTTPPLAGVVGANSGTLAWNPTFVQAHEGEEVWYSPQNFTESSTGTVGLLTDATHFIAPVPGPTERPIIRLGNRAPLTVLLAATEAALTALSVPSGSVGIALSTGKLKFATADIDKADPGTRAVPNPSFDPLYLNVQVRYDGIAGNLYPQPIKAPVQLVNIDGISVASFDTTTEVFIPDAKGLGTGLSGILNVPDGTGNPPDLTAAIGPRPGDSGVVRRLSSGFGDVYLFSDNGIIAKVLTVNFEDELEQLGALYDTGLPPEEILPTKAYSVPLDTVYVALDQRSSISGSKVLLGSSLSQSLIGQTLYFVQAELLPSIYPDTARLYSRIRDSYTLDGTESLAFSIDGTSVTWNASALGAGTYTPTQIATSLGTAVTGAGATGSAGVLSGYVYIQSNTPTTGQVQILFSLSGCRVLGFPPGWDVTNPIAGDHSATDGNWLPDTGLEFGLRRSPQNLDGSQPISDVRSTYRVTDEILANDISSIPYQLLSYPPREDIAGYDVGVFFRLSAQGKPGASPSLRASLAPFEDVLYEFDKSRFGWLSSRSFVGQLESPATSLDLGVQGVVGATFYAAMGGLLKISATGEAATYRELDTDFLVPEGSGSALLIGRIGPEVLKGSRGRFTAGGSVLTDTSVTFTGTAQIGYRVKAISGNDQGSYTVTSVGATTLGVSPPFVNGDGSQNVSWVLYSNVAPGDVDPSVIADIVYEDFSPLPNEPFEVRVLTLLGVAGGALDPLDVPTVNSGQSLTIRFDRTGADIPVTVLTSTPLGTMVNGSLIIPSTGARFTTGSFTVQVGTRTFVQGTDLLPVAAFSPDPGANIEYLTVGVIGELKFGSTVLADFDSAQVTYLQTVLPAASIGTSTAEVDPNTGELGLSSVDLAANVDKNVYVAVLQELENVYINPILGSFTFVRPLKAGQLVEAQYYRAVPDSGALFLDSTGATVQVREFLPLYVRRELATRVSDRLYSFNPTSRTTESTVEAQVYVDTKLVSYGVPSGVVVTWTNNTLSLKQPVDVTSRVMISYAVYEAFGGETSYTVSQAPVWRPPFNIAKNQGTLSFIGNRTSTITLGKQLRVGGFLTYVRAATYVSASDSTTVTIFPAPATNAGTLAPSETPLTFLTDRPVTPLIDPTGATPTAVPSADAGFLPELTVLAGLASIPVFQTVAVGDTTVQFEGDFTRYMLAGFMLEMFGIPFLIVKSELTPDGRYTTVTFGSPSPMEFVWSVALPANRIRVSARPVYPSGASTFLGPGGFLPTEPYEVVLYGEMDGATLLPGRTLVEGRDFNIDTNSGHISFLAPRLTGLASLQSLKFYRTDVTTLSPGIYRGAVQYPRVSATFSYLDPPSEANGRIHGILQGTFTFDSPDSFYARSVPLSQYISETAASLTSNASAQLPGSNPAVGGFQSPAPSAQGLTGIVSQRQDLVSRDRVTRTFLRYFNGLVTSFEQVLETLSGNPIGDRDGKLRLWMGTGDQWVPPGYEDAITGAVNDRNVWFDVWMSYRTGLPTIRLIAADPILDPLTATTDSKGRPTGNALHPQAMSFLMGLQPKGIKNDVDDVVLTGLRGTTTTLAGFVYFQTTSYGTYQGLGEASPFSRLFGERTTAFTTTEPGLGATTTGNNGVYSAGKIMGDLFNGGLTIQSTNGKVIARLANPVRGAITNVLGVEVKDRLARARILAYSPTGFPTVDAGSTGFPSILATVLPLDQLPLLPDGLPDISQLASVPPTSLAKLPDLNTGDPTLHTPPFKAGDQLAFGTPNGSVYQLGYTGTPIPVGTGFQYAGIFVDSILQGCLIILKSKDLAGVDVQITVPTSLVLLSAPTVGAPFTAERGDSLFVVPTTGRPITLSDPPTTAQLDSLVGSLPSYRTGTDINFIPRTGELTDATLPSFSDPNIFGLKELLGQRPPSPLSNLEAQVSFQNGDVLPSNIPALQGESKLDSGDYSLPYYGINNTELDVLGEVLPIGIDLITLDSIDPVVDNPPPIGYPVYAVEAVYPDEILDNAGIVDSTDPDYPSAILTTQDLQPSAAVYPAPGHKGVGTVDRYDLVLIEEATGSALPLGSTGIFSVGDVTHGATSVIEPPRFVSATTVGLRHSLAINNIQAWFDQTHVTGIMISEDTTVPGNIVTTFTLPGVPTTQIVWDNGLGGGALAPPVGGFNDYFRLADKPTTATIKVIDPVTNNFVPGAYATFFLETVNPADVRLCTFSADGSLFAPTAAVFLSGFGAQTLVVTSIAPFFNFAAYPSTTVGAVTTLDYPMEFAIDIDSTHTLTFAIEGDRLTLSGPIDPRTAYPRGSLTTGGDPVQCELSTRDSLTSIYSTLAGTFVTTFSSANHISQVNGNLPFTFLSRSGILPNGIGSMSGGVGQLKVMGFEEYGSVAIDSTGITFSALTSSRQDALNGAILNAVAISDQKDDAGVAYKPARDNRFILPGGAGPLPAPLPASAVIKGDVDRVLPGDTLVVHGFYDDGTYTYPLSSGKAGTHLVRGTIKSTDIVATPFEHRDTYAMVTGDPNGGWLDFEFPTVTGVVSGATLDLVVTEILALTSLKDWAGAPIAQTHTFPSAGKVFIILDEAKLLDPASGVYKEAIYSADYASMVPGTGTFVDLTNYKNGIGVGIGAGQFTAAIANGMKVSGMTIVPVNPHGTGIPENLPGYTSIIAPDPIAIFGFRAIQALGPSAVPLGWAAAATGTLDPTGLELTAVNLYTKDKASSNVFLALDQAVYDEIPGALDAVLNDTDWDTLHTTGAFVPSGSRCLLPTDTWTVDYSGAAAIYVEPSVPHSCNDLSLNRVNVVDSVNSLTLAEVGARRLSTYVAAAPPVNNSWVEYVQLEIKRPRRFHAVNDALALSLGRLRASYEIRRGIVQTLVSSGSICTLTAEPVDNHYPPVAVVGGHATQLGDFTNPDLNLHVGDVVRFLDSNGEVSDTAEILNIPSTITLVLSKKVTFAPGTKFEIYLKVPPVPQEQSNEELLGFATDTVLLSRSANYTAQTGGKVLTRNILADTDGALDYTALDIQVGDVVVIDPVGPLEGPTGPASPTEMGVRPFGDNGVSSRGASYVAGSPSRADDNRGYYWVDAIAAQGITVTATGNLLAGDTATGDILFGTAAAYTVYPTVHASGLTGTTEGQQDLRPTSFAGVGNSYRLDYKSVAPFSYRILRPSPFLSRETVELILSMRERMLSWMEEIRGAANQESTYFVFQRDHHISDLGSTFDLGSGLGVFHTTYLEGLIGRWDITPFVNVSDGLSILDRRFWGLDFRLDTLVPPLGISATPYANFTGTSVDPGWDPGETDRPVLVDRINEALDSRDQLRQTRYSWLTLRTHRTTGTMEGIRRFDQELPSRKAEQERALTVTKSVKLLTR